MLAMQLFFGVIVFICYKIRLSIPLETLEYMYF